MCLFFLSRHGFGCYHTDTHIRNGGERDVRASKLEMELTARNTNALRCVDDDDDDDDGDDDAGDDIKKRRLPRVDYYPPTHNSSAHTRTYHFIHSQSRLVALARPRC